MATQSTTTPSSNAQTDPVCRMQIDPTRAAGSSQHGGKTHYFCSAGCKAKFDKNPAEFADSPRPKGSGCC